MIHPGLPRCHSHSCSHPFFHRTSYTASYVNISRWDPVSVLFQWDLATLLFQWDLATILFQWDLINILFMVWQ